MGWIWTLVVCLGAVFYAAPVLTQNSSRTLFLISGPDVVHAGTPTSLAVTVLSDLPARVTAELTHGDIRVVQTEDFQGGLTRVLTLPPVPGSISHNSLFNLTVRGFRGDSVIFTNTTTLGFNLRNVSSFIQMDKSRYQPGDNIRVRIVSVQLDNRPYTGTVDIAVQDPRGDVVGRWKSTGTLGVVLQEFSLTETAPLGQWMFTATVNGVTEEKPFSVEHHAERPHFEVMLKTPPRVLVGDDFSGSVRALYQTGQPVLGTLSVSISLAPDMMPAAAEDKLTQTKKIYGSTQFFLSKDQLRTLHTSAGSSSSAKVHVVVCVTSNSTRSQVNKTVEVLLMRNAYQLTFRDLPSSLRPSLNFSTKLRISRYDLKPLSLRDREHLAVVEVDQRTSAMNSTQSTTLTASVPEDGDVHIELQLQAQVQMLFIRARFQSSEETLTLYNNYVSPSSSYIQISPITASPAQVGSPLEIAVESTFDLAALHFVVSATGQVLAAGTQNSSSFHLSPTLAWSPEACITIYCILPDGEVASDTAHVPISQHHHVSLNWSRGKARPGEQVSLSVSPVEPGSHVGIVVMAMHDDETPEEDLRLKVEQEWHIWMLTNAALYQQKQPHGPQNGRVSKGDMLLVEKYWSPWMDATESLVWLDTTVSDTKWTGGEITVPDGITALGAVALVMSGNLGLRFTPVPTKMSVSKDFSLRLNVPSYLIRGEEVVVEVDVINHLEQDLEVIVLIAQGAAFEFVLGKQGDVSVVNAHKLTLSSYAFASAWFPVKPTALGEMEICVDAVSAEASDSLVWTVHVKPEGVEQSYSQTLFLELAPEKHNNSRSVSFSFPDVVPGSQRAHVALVGDLLALSFNNLDSLVQLPQACGEQNMIRFAPSVYVLQYLDKSTLDDAVIRKRALGYMMEGYQRQLSFQRQDGSFGSFGDSDPSGSVWLTAFVVRCFLNAQPYMQVDSSVLTRAITWLLKHQGPQGEFREVGRLIHTEIQGGHDNSSVALTAYVAIALLEVDTYAEMYRTNVTLATRYLESKVSSEVLSNYSLCLVTYALALANSPEAANTLSQLRSRADYTDGVMMWTSSAGLKSRDWQPYSAQIEMASYVLLALFKRASLLEGIAHMKWLSKRRNYLGGFGTTQDTVVGLQALSNYAAFSGANAIDLRLNVSAPAVSLFSINSSTYRMYQSQEINADQDLHINVYMEGRGFAIFQMNVFYNVRSSASSQASGHPPDEEALSLLVDVAEDKDHNHMLLSMCMRLKESQAISQTGMVILDVGLLSGFRLSPGAAALTDLIRKVEVLPEKVSLYLHSLNKSEVCIGLPLSRNHKVARVQDALVQVYDYYEPQRKAVRTYNSDFLRNTGSSFFCGSDCGLCKPGITVTVPGPSPVLSRSVNSATHRLSCVLLGVLAFLSL